MIPPVIGTYVYIPFSPPFYLLYLEVIYALTLKIASMGHVTGVFIVPEQRGVTCSVLFYFRLVPEAFKCEPMHRNGKPYHLFSHIFLPPFVYIISITHAGLADPCVIGTQPYDSTESKYLNLPFALQYFVFCKKFWQLSHYENVLNNGWKNG